MYDKDKILADIDMLNLVDTIGLESHRSGKNTFIRCPDHDDNVISNCVITNKGYRCYACGSTGDVFTLIEHTLGVSYIKALQIAAESCGDVNNYTISSEKTQKKSNKIPFIAKTDCDILNIIVKPVYANVSSVDDDDDLESKKIKVDCGDNEYTLMAQKCIMNNPLKEIYDNDIKEYKRFIIEKAVEALRCRREMNECFIKMKYDEFIEAQADDIRRIEKIIINHGGIIPKENIFKNLYLSADELPF